MRFVALHMFISTVYNVRHFVLTTYSQLDCDQQQEMRTRVILQLTFPNDVDYIYLLLNILCFPHIGSHAKQVQLDNVTRNRADYISWRVDYYVILCCVRLDVTHRYIALIMRSKSERNMSVDLFENVDQ